MAEQLTFDWPNGIALGAEDLFVSTSNAVAYGMLETPENWPQRKLVITGPAGAGKTHLARIFATQQGALVASADALPPLPADGAAVVIEDMDSLPQDAEEQMFHLHNHLHNTGGTLLMTARTAPSRWGVALPDLASRMTATTVAPIEAPDDTLMQALFMKLFADRQINPQPQLIAYLATRSERSFDAVAAMVEKLDRTALEQGRPISRALARRLLDKDTASG